MVPVNKELLTGTALVNKELLTGTVLVKKELLTGMVPVNNSVLTKINKIKEVPELNQSKISSDGNWQ